MRTATGIDVAQIVDTHRLAQVVQGGFLVRDDDRLRTTAEGRLRLNAILSPLLVAAEG